MEVFGLVGTGGFAREILPSLERDGRFSENLLYVTNNAKTLKAVIHKKKVILEEDFFQIRADRYFNIAIAESNIRRKISDRFLDKGCIPKEIFGYNCSLGHGVDLGYGAILCTNTILTTDIKVGKFFHCNINSYVAHDCLIGDFVTFAPNVACNGNVEIHDYAYIGTGAILKQGTSSKKLVIGEGAIVGMGAVVTKDVEAYTTVIGNPARKF